MADLCKFDSSLTTFDSSLRTFDQTTCGATATPPTASSGSSGSEYRRRRSGLGPAPRRKREDLEELAVEKEVLEAAVEEVKVDIQFASSEPLKAKLAIELDGLERKIKQIEEEELIFVLAMM